MALSDLVVKMTLNTKEFSGDINAAKKQIHELQVATKNAGDFVNNLGGNLLKGAAKFAGWAGAGMAAKEGLEKFMRAGQTTSDWIDREVAAWSGTFDEFFRSLNNGSVAGFVSNMLQVAESIRQATTAADAFADAKASMNVISLKYDVEQRKILELIKRNKDNPALVKALQGQLRQLEEDRKKSLSGVVEQKQVSVDADILAKFVEPMKAGVAGLGGKTLDKILQSQKTTLTELMSIFQSETLNSFDAALKEAKALAGKTMGTMQVQSYGMYGSQVQTKQYEKSILTDQDISNFKNKWGFSIADIIKYSELADDVRNSLRNAIQELYALQKSEFEFNERNTEIFNIGKIGTTGAGGKKATAKVYAEGQLGYYDQEISKKRKELQEATTAVGIATIQEEIRKLEFARDALLNAAGLKTISGKLSPVTVNSTKIDKKNLPVPESNYELPQPPDYTNAVQGLGAMGDMMRSFSDLTNEGATAWLNWAGSALNALRGVFMAFQSTTMAGAASGAASAGPFGWLTIPAAIATALAAFMTIPKFESGGIVGGASYTGDKILARLNSREMVLNTAQQSKLWGMLNNGNNGGGTVQFEIKGSTLVGVLNNYNSRRSHVL